MNFSVEVKLNPSLQKELTQQSDRIVYQVANGVLGQSKTTIPLRTGAMRRSSITSGVKGSNLDYYIGSYTSYASKVWNFPDSTNWTTPGTNNKWYERTWKTKGQLITKTIVERNKL